MLPTAKPNVVFCTVDDGAVLLSTTDEVYYGLNAVGAMVWQLLPPESTTIDDLCRKVSAAYPEVVPDAIRSDVQDLLDELLSHGLVESS